LNSHSDIEGISSRIGAVLTTLGACFCPHVG
jgi:hypothetical protein